MSNPTSVQPEKADKAPKKERNASLWADARRELLRNPIFIISTIIIVVVASMALVPWLWTGKDPEACSVSGGNFLIPPPWWPDGMTEKEAMASWDHPFGVDQTGCDYYAHLIWGSRFSLLIAFMAVTGTVLLGGLLGMLSGFYGRWVDAIISRITDIFLALPFLIGAIVMLSVFRIEGVWGRVYMVAFVLIVLGWGGYTRILRGSVIEAKSQDYVAAAKALGATNSRMMFKHILPNAVAPTVVLATIAFGGFIAAEAVLTFLGVGLRAPAVSWGLMISSHQGYFFDEPWLMVIPSTVLVVTVLSFILIGDALRDALDPKLR